MRSTFKSTTIKMLTGILVPLERNITPLRGWAGPFVAAALFLLSYSVWLFGLKHYNGMGS